MTTNGVSDRAIEVLTFVAQYRGEKGIAPTYREIGKACKISTTSLVSHYLDQLELAGYVKRHHGVPRGIVVLNGKGDEHHSTIG